MKLQFWNHKTDHVSKSVKTKTNKQQYSTEPDSHCSIVCFLVKLSYFFYILSYAHLTMLTVTLPSVARCLLLSVNDFWLCFCITSLQISLQRIYHNFWNEVDIHSPYTVYNKQEIAWAIYPLLSSVINTRKHKSYLDGQGAYTACHSVQDICQQSLAETLPAAGIQGCQVWQLELILCLCVIHQAAHICPAKQPSVSASWHLSFYFSLDATQTSNWHWEVQVLTIEFSLLLTKLLMPEQSF